jgi:hypothetical protein
MGPSEVKLSEPPQVQPDDKERIATLENEVKKLKERLGALEQNFVASRANQNAMFG